ncbi:MAG: IS1634 family transposase [Candidatus Binatia bacterium]
MACLIHKKKKGRLYTYWVQSARVQGQPRIVEQVYLGPKERVLEEIKRAYTRGKAPGRSPLRKVQHREFGASAWLWQWAQRLQLQKIVDRHVPAPAAKRRTQLSVGQYLVLAAINRAIQARSKRAFYRHWYRDSIISRLCPAQEGELTSQRFWDHMDQVQESHLDAIQQDLLSRLKELFPLGEETLLYDTTNYFTFIDTFNRRPELPQRGYNKQKRHDLRQLSLAFFEDEETGLPLYHQCYRGDRPDVAQFTTAWQGMVQVWMKGLRRGPKQLTLVFDAGNSGRDNVGELDEAGLHYVGAIPGRWVPDLLDVPREAYEKLELAATKHVKVHRCRRELWGRRRTLLVVFSPSFFRKQRAAMNRLQHKVEGRLIELAGGIERWRTSRKGAGYKQSSVERKIKEWTARDHLREFLQVEIQTEGERVAELRWQWDQKKKREIQRRYLGKTVLFTDRDDWDSEKIVLTYRSLTRQEHLFSLSKGRQGLWWPMFHWTDTKIRVHALYCHFALLLLAILQIQLREARISLNAPRAVGRLEKIQESLVIYTNGAGERVLSDMDEEQWRLAEVLGLLDLAEEMGTTVLDKD